MQCTGKLANKRLISDIRFYVYPIVTKNKNTLQKATAIDLLPRKTANIVGIYYTPTQKIKQHWICSVMTNYGGLNKRTPFF